MKLTRLTRLGRLRKFEKISEVFLLLLLSSCRPTPVPSTPTRPAPSTPIAGPTFTPGTTLTPGPAPTLTPTLTPTIPTNTVIERGELPPGFSLTTYAEVFSPTSLAFGPDGRLYVASTNAVVYAFADTDSDRRADKRDTFAWDVQIPLGLLWVGNTLYISYNGAVKAVADTDGDGISDRVTVIVSDLPADGRHQNDSLAMGTDGYIYLGMGSTCDACLERNRLNASILRFKPDGSELSVYASGLRNPYDLAFNAEGDLFATDNGRDDLGDDLPPEELNHIRAGLNYGWPDCWEGNNADPICGDEVAPVAIFEAHSSANGLTFYEGENFPAGYHGDAFVAIFGSYILPQIERGVARVKLTKQGETYVGQSEWFLKIDGRPLDVTAGPDGGLYVVDYENGAVYRIVYGAP